MSIALAVEAAARGTRLVLTSAFESGVAHAHIAILASVLGGPSVAHGLSTFERLASDVLEPAFADAVRADLVDVAKISGALDATADALVARNQKPCQAPNDSLALRSSGGDTMY